MTTLTAARAANESALSSASSNIPVALFVGGTSGIGQAVAEAFAKHTKGNAHIIICGRNRKAAEDIIASFPSSSDKGKYEFVECDATLMKNVQNTTSSLLSSLPKLNYIVATTGFLTLNGRDETTEGIDKKLALNYYARWKFVCDLMPLLEKAKEAGEDAKVLSVLAAGMGGKIDLDDLGLKKGYSVVNASLSAVTYTDCMIESLAEAHPTMTFTHTHPGIVRTPILKTRDKFLQFIYPLTSMLIYPFSYSASDSGEYMLNAMLAGDKGSFRKGARGEMVGQKGYYVTEEAKKKLWEHTVKATKVD